MLPSSLSWIKAVRCRKMHTRGKSKWISIQHGIICVEMMRCAASGGASRIRSRCLCYRWGTLHAHSSVWICGRQSEIRDEIVRFDLVAVVVFKHVGLRIVLLICTHGLSLGRTKLYYNWEGKRNGTACRVGHSASEKMLDSSSAASRMELEACWAETDAVVL